MNLVNFRFETGADGVALATWEMPERTMNVITPEVMDELEQLIDAVVAAPDGNERLRDRVGQDRLFRRRRSFHAAAWRRAIRQGAQ